jgi:hypothetical protein
MVYKIIIDKVLVLLKATEIRIFWRFPEAAGSSEARMVMCFSKDQILSGFSVVVVF